AAAIVASRRAHVRTPRSGQVDTSGSDEVTTRTRPRANRRRGSRGRAMETPHDLQALAAASGATSSSPHRNGAPRSAKSPGLFAGAAKRVFSDTEIEKEKLALNQDPRSASAATW